MTTLDASAVHDALQAALDDTRAWAKRIHATPSLRSSMFCWSAGEALHPVVRAHVQMPLEKKQIEVRSDGTRKAGEWLVDIAWVSMVHPDPALGVTRKVPLQVWCVAESESQTNGYELFVDLAKLAHMRSPLKIFLAGLNQATPDAADAYVARRLQQIDDYLDATPESGRDATWLVAFWPSPLARNGRSLWDQDGYEHLDRVRTFIRGDDGFQPV